MNTTTIRTGKDEVTLVTDKSEVGIRYGQGGISATIYLDWGEARELAEAILGDFAEVTSLPEGRHVANQANTGWLGGQGDKTLGEIAEGL